MMCRACDAMGLAPVVRIPAADSVQAAIAYTHPRFIAAVERADVGRLRSELGDR